MTTLSLLFFLLFSPPATVNGIVQDASGGAIASARIQVFRAGASLETRTDSAGRFTLDELPAGSYSAVVSAPGFAAQVVPVTIPSEPLTFTLKVAPHGDDILVTTTRVETPASMVGVSASVLDRDTITEQQAPTLYELLRDMPGMAVSNTSRRGGTTSIFTRGGGKDANLMLVDGIQINDPGGDFNFAHFMTTNIDRVEIVRGPQSAIYGSNAAAAVIQVTSHQGSSEEGPASGFGSFEAGNLATSRYRAGLSGAFKNLDYAWSGERLGTQGAYVNDSYRNLTLAENIGYRLNSLSQVRFTLRNIGSWVGVPNKVGYGLLDPDAFRTGANIISGFRYERTTERFSQHVQLGFTRFRDYFQDNLGEGPFRIGAMVTGTPGQRGSRGVRLVRLLSNSEIAAPNTVGIPPGDRIVLNSVSISATAPSTTITERRTAEYQGNWSYSSRNSLIFGYDFEQERGITNVAPPLRNNHGLFLNHQHSLGTRLFLTESVRYEDNSVFHTKVTPRLAASYLLTATTRLKASAGTGISEPSFLENFAKDPTFVGNPNLRPEKSQSVEAGVEQHFLGSRVVADATLFGSRFRDLIVFTFLPPPQPSTWINLEASRAEGLETGLRVQVSRIRFHGQYTFLDTRVTAAASPSSASTGIGQELPRRPRHSGAFDVTAAFRRGFVNWNTTFVGERQDSDGVGLGIVRNPRYEKTDLGGNYKLTSSIDGFVRLENLFDRKYEEVLGYTALPRTFLAGVTFHGRLR
jgi:outer membrane cobalamin receptor